MKGKQLVVLYRDERGMPRAHAVGSASDRDSVLEAARYQAEAYQMTRAVIDGTEPRLSRDEVVLD